MRRQILAAGVVLAVVGGAMVWGGAAPAGPAGPPAPQGRGTREDLAAQEAALLMPDTAVTLEQLRAVVRLDVELNPPKEPQAMGFSSIIIMDEMPGYQAAYAKYGSELAQSLAGKSAAARGACVETLLNGYVTLSAADQGRVRPFVPGVLETMGKEEVTGVLNNRWTTVRSPELLAELLKLYDALPDEQVSAGKYGAAQERDALLRRAYELDPQQVRGRVLAAIKDPGARFYEFWVDALLGLPEMDETFVAMLNAPRGGVPADVAMKLVARYGTAKIEADMKQAYERAEGRWACTFQEQMLAYFLRVDPVYGQQALARAVGSRQTGCWQSLLRDEADVIWTPELEKQAISGLESREAQVQASAARALATKGSPAAKAALLTALAGAAGGGSDQRRALVTALLRGHGWVLSAEELKRVETLAVDAELVKMCQDRATQTAVPLTLSMAGSGKPKIYLEGATYQTLAELEQKASLYPAGTRFKVTGDAEDEACAAFAAWAKGRGMVVE